MLRQWQTTIEVSDHPEEYFEVEKKCIYGETVGALLVAVRAFLHERKPQYFSNGGDHITGRFQYYYSDGELLREMVMEESETRRWEEELTKGWWCKELAVMLDAVTVKQFEEASLGWSQSFEHAIQHFIRWAVIPERGPDYLPEALEDSSSQLHLLKRVLREKEEYVVNDLIRRGWSIIALEHQGTLGAKEELVNRHAVFVLGHADQEAAQQTFDAKYYHEYLKQYG